MGIGGDDLIGKISFGLVMGMGGVLLWSGIWMMKVPQLFPKFLLPRQSTLPQTIYLPPVVLLFAMLPIVGILFGGGLAGFLRWLTLLGDRVCVILWLLFV